MVALKTSEADAFVARPDPARTVVLVFGPDAGLVSERVDAPNGTPEARIATELQNALQYEINGTEGLISPTHALKLRMNVGRNSILTDINTGLVVAEITGIDANFTLTELATGKVVMRGNTFARVSSQYPGQQQRFARVRARVDAESRAAKEIAENVRTRVASYFVAGT